MPQMKPMLWVNLMIMFSSFTAIVMIWLFFSPIQSPKTSKSNKPTPTTQNKWQ